MSSAIALIPARGGSKRLPRKNVIEFFGRPILAHTIDAAGESGCFDRVVVSTEDEEIKEVSLRYGAAVDDRPEHLATDMAKVHDVCLDYLERESIAGREYSLMCCLYPTAPLRGADDIRAVVNLIDMGGCQFALAVTPYGLPPHQALRWHTSGHVTPLFPELIRKRDSEIGTVVVDNGSTYAVHVPAFLKERSFVGPNIKGHLMPRNRSPDINVREDLELAAYYYRQQRVS